MRKYLFIENLSLLKFPLAIILKMFGFYVRYYNMTSFTKKYYPFINSCGIFGLSWADRSPGIISSYIKNSEEYTDVILNKVLKKSLTLKMVCSSLNFSEDTSKQSNLLKNLLIKRISSTIQFKTLIDDYVKDSPDCRIYILCSNLEFQKIILSYDLKRPCIFISTTLFVTISSMWNLTLKVLNRVYEQLKKKKNIKSLNESVASSSSIQELSKFEIAFLPHQGIFYGHFYVKDQYYQKSLTSPFHKQKILHLSQRDNARTVKESILYYHKHNIPYKDIYNLLPKKFYYHLVLKLMLFVFSALDALIKELLRGGLGNIAISFSFFYGILLHRTWLQKIPNLKIVLIGYDFQFDPLLAVILTERGIKAISTQERFALPLWPHFTPLFDYYFSVGDVITDFLAKKFEQNKYLKIESIGDVRVNLINETTISNDDDLLMLKKKYFIMLILDAYSSFSEQSRLYFVNNIQSNLKFYCDIIKLAKLFPQIYFIIKGKNYEFCNLLDFREVVSDIEASDNMTVIKDYKKYTPEKVVSISDAAIAIHTSLADEMLSIGKPVIFYEGCYDFPSCLFDYKGFPIIVKNFNELVKKVDKILNSESHHLLSNNQIRYLQKYFYHDSHKGMAREILHKRLNEIYNELSNK